LLFDESLDRIAIKSSVDNKSGLRLGRAHHGGKDFLLRQTRQGIRFARSAARRAPSPGGFRYVRLRSAVISPKGGAA